MCKHTYIVWSRMYLCMCACMYVLYGFTRKVNVIYTHKVICYVRKVICYVYYLCVCK